METGPELIPLPVGGSTEMPLPCAPEDSTDGEPAQVNHALEKAAELTPFMRQWSAAKQQNPDALLFFRMGDFYELFYDDAVVASRELQLTLTARDRERQVPMCGVPYHSVESYLMRLLRNGFRIAICDQMEDPKLTKKIVRREVTRVLSPGTALDPGLGRTRTISWQLILRPGQKTNAAVGSCARLPYSTCRPGTFGLPSFTAPQHGNKRATRF
jgi:DNA mismatch repair ATPase MutS